MKFTETDEVFSLWANQVNKISGDSILEKDA